VACGAVQNLERVHARPSTLNLAERVASRSRPSYGTAALRKVQAEPTSEGKNEATKLLKVRSDESQSSGCQWAHAGNGKLQREDRAVEVYAAIVIPKPRTARRGARATSIQHELSARQRAVAHHGIMMIMPYGTASGTS
jgi:hypothetical protein